MTDYEESGLIAPRVNANRRTHRNALQVADVEACASADNTLARGAGSTQLNPYVRRCQFHSFPNEKRARSLVVR